MRAVEFPREALVRVRALLGPAALTVVLLVLAALWVPIDTRGEGHYYAMNYFEGFGPRRLLGTVIRLMDLGPGAVVAMRHGFQTLWLFLIVLAIGRRLEPKDRNASFPTTVLVALSFLFCFHTVVYITNGNGLMIDVVPYAFTLSATLLALPASPRAYGPRELAASALLALGVLTHEKSVFDLAILAVWLCWKFGPRRSAAVALPGTLAAAAILIASRHEVEVSRFADGATSPLAYLMGNSLNLWGVLVAGGMLWIVLFLVVRDFVRLGAGSAVQRAGVAAAMILLCFAGLLVAHDTNRMVGLMWLPTLVLLLEVGPSRLAAQLSTRRLLVVLCLLQLAVPPLLVYNHGGLALNCYSLKLMEQTPRVRWPDGLLRIPGPLTLYSHAPQRPTLTQDIRCWPPGVTR